MSDVICTSSNAEKIVARSPADRPILFAPDQHLGRCVAKQTGREPGALAGQLHGARDLQREAPAHAEGAAPGRRGGGPPGVRGAVLRRGHVGTTRVHPEARAASPAAASSSSPRRGSSTRCRSTRRTRSSSRRRPTAGARATSARYMRLNTLEKLYLCMRRRTPELTMPRRCSRPPCLRSTGCWNGPGKLAPRRESRGNGLAERPWPPASFPCRRIAPRPAAAPASGGVHL